MHRAVAEGTLHAMINTPFHPVKDSLVNKYYQVATVWPVLCKVLEIQEADHVLPEGANVPVCVYGWGWDGNRHLTK